MGLYAWCREELRRRYRAHFLPALPEGTNGPHVVCIDMMQFIKGSLPENVLTLGDLLPYLIFQATRHLQGKNAASIVVVCFDGDSPEPKKMVDHVTRKDWRCAACKKTEKYSPACKRNCRARKPLKPRKGPHLSLDTSAPLPDWKRFSLHTQNLRNELYPRLYNAFMNFTPPPNKLIILQKFPTRAKKVKAFQDILDNSKPFSRDETVVIPETWSLQTLKSDLEKAKQEDADLWNRVLCIMNNGNQIVRHFDPLLDNDIKEADNAVYFFSQFYPQFNHMSVINDGDAISIGLFRVIENIRDGQHIHKHWLCMPYKKKKDRPPSFKDAKWEYVELGALHNAIENDPELQDVANPTATLIFLMILANTDFFKNFCPGIGFEKGIWPTFFKHKAMLTHLVQWNCYEMVPDLSKSRRIVIDEELFVHFVYLCYMEKYGAALKKEVVDAKMIEVHCSKKSASRRMPTNAEIRLKARHVLWNLQYWVNAFRNIYPDPFEKYQGQSYFGFEKLDDGTMRIAKTVCASQKPVDEAYKRHFYKRLKKKELKIKISQKKKNVALQKIQGKL